MNNHHLAQINISRLLEPIDSPLLSDFVAQLDEINSLAESSEGFVWRLKSDNNNATEIQVFDDSMIIVNMSVWENLESLRNFAFKTAHAAVMKNRNKWFEKMDSAYLALWWIPAGHIPTTDEAKERLEHINLNGDTPFAFTFKNIYSPQS